MEVVIDPVIKPVVEPTKEVKTPPNELFGALQEERKKRKVAEDALKQLQTPQISDEQRSDEGRALLEELRKSNERIDALVREKELDTLYAKYPAIREKADEFVTFQATKEGYSSDDVARLFISEHKLDTKPRKGLERAVSNAGTRETTTEISDDEVMRLMQNEPKKLESMMRQGKI